MHSRLRLGMVSCVMLFFANSVVLAEACADDTYQAPSAFVSEAFGGTAPSPKLLWITAKLKPHVHEILDHDLGQLRVRYWTRDGRTVWILDEIGKTKPITTGIVIESGRIAQLKPLIYRESHGWEVRYPFFTDQFKGLALTDDDKKLSKHVDGISGATLSVSALKRLARLALYFDAQVSDAHD